LNKTTIKRLGLKVYVFPAPSDLPNYQTSVNQQYFNINNRQQQLYQPFPSLNPTPFFNGNDLLSSKPPLPSLAANNSRNTVPTLAPAVALNDPRSNGNDRNNIDVNTFNRGAITGFMPASFATNNRYDPFPSLNTMKTVPEFYGMQGVNYRKTRLW